MFRLRMCQNMVIFTVNDLVLPFRDAGRLTQGAAWDTEGRARDEERRDEIRPSSGTLRSIPGK